jgi:hypothetical protein
MGRKIPIEAIEKRRSLMKISRILSMALLAAAGCIPGWAQQYCFSGLLQGNYAFTITGQILAGPSAGPVTGVALTSFDGQGNLTQVDHVVHNGGLPAVAWRPGTGTYTLNPDCTGNAQINFTDGSPSLTLYFVLVFTNSGSEIRTVVNNAETNITSTGIKQN